MQASGPKIKLHLLWALWKSWLKTQQSKLKLNIQNLNHGIWTHHFMANRWGKNGNSDRLYFLGLQNLCGQFLQP